MAISQLFYLDEEIGLNLELLLMLKNYIAV